MNILKRVAQSLVIILIIVLVCDSLMYTTCAQTSEENLIIYYSTDDAIDIAKVLYRECRGIPSDTEKACVAWTILNRVDNWGMSIKNVVRAPHQFAYVKNTTIDENLLSLAYDVLSRWNLEKNGYVDVGRVLPKDYMYFTGNGKHNYFRNAYNGKYTVWNYALPSPYIT